MQKGCGIVFAQAGLYPKPNAMHFKSLIHLLDFFKDEETCIKYYEKTRWQFDPFCPHCGSRNPYVISGGYKCKTKCCRKKFNVKTRTIFENTKLPMRIWFAAIYLCTTSKKGISSLQLARQLQITQKTAWFLLHRVRTMLEEKEPTIMRPHTPVEIDEAYVGGKQRNKHYNKKRSRKKPELTNEGKPYKPKKTVVGIIQRGGDVLLTYVPDVSQDKIVDIIRRHVPRDSVIYTDEHNFYRPLYRWYNHQSINHSEKQYVDGDVHTNTIENFWSLLKRAIIGIFHHVSEKHIDRYLAEFSGRYNTRYFSSKQRFEKWLNQSDRRLTYKNLTKAA